MNTVHIEGDRLVVEPQGLDKLWSLRRRIEVPTSHVVGATYDPGASHEPKGLRAGGTHVPGKTAGTYRRDGETTFYNISRPEQTVVVELRDEHFARLVLGVADPRALVDRINQLVS